MIQKKSKQTGLYYCGRENIINKTQTCGPKQGPNCCACRVLINDDLPIINNNHDLIWQGETGFFYCGQFFGKQNDQHDGFCGPNNGPSCKSCKILLENL